MAKARTALASLPGGIPNVPGMSDVEILKKAIADTHQLRDAVAEDRRVIESQGQIIEQYGQALSYALPELNRLVYEAERTRAVNQRMFALVSQGPNAGFIVGNTPRGYELKALLEAEAMFTAEYDVLMAFTVLAETYNPPETGE